MGFPDQDIAIVSKENNMDFLILLGQMLDEFVKFNQNLNSISRTLSAIENQLDDINNKMG